MLGLISPQRLVISISGYRRVRSGVGCRGRGRGVSDVGDNTQFDLRGCNSGSWGFIARLSPLGNYSDSSQ